MRKDGWDVPRERGSGKFKRKGGQDTQAGQRPVKGKPQRGMVCPTDCKELRVAASGECGADVGADVRKC